MDRQLTAAGCDDRRELPFHKAVLNGELPYTIGGGIGPEPSVHAAAGQRPHR